MTTRPPMTHLQSQVLAYLVKFLELNDQLPPVSKIAEAFGWASANSADLHLKCLEKKGYLTRNEMHHLMLADRPALSPVFIGIDLAQGCDRAVWWAPRTEVAHG